MPTFFDLPSELRNRVYEPLVVSPDIIECIGFDPVAPPPITRVCRQMRAESLSMYYERNVFQLTRALWTCQAARRTALINNHFGNNGGERPSSKNCPIGVLGTWIQEIGTVWFNYVRLIILPIYDTHPPDTSEDDGSDPDHCAEVVLCLGEGAGKLSRAHICVQLEEGQRFRRDPETDFSRGKFAVEYGRNTNLFWGCAPFNHFVYRYLSSQEPEINGRREVPLTPPADCTLFSLVVEDDSCDSEDGDEDEGADPTEVVPPTVFYPTTDIFTVLSVLDDAVQYHCCCCMREPATPAPTKQNQKSRLTYDDDPFIKYTCADWPFYCDDVNWEVIEAKNKAMTSSSAVATAATEDNADDNGSDEEESVYTLERFSFHYELLDALMAVDHDYMARYSKAHYHTHPSFFNFYPPWKEARLRAGYTVPREW